MDVIIKRKHPIIRYKYYIAGGFVFVGFLVYVIFASSGPRRLRYDVDKLTIAEVKYGKFREYLDPEGTVHPILTMKINALESGTVERIVAESGSMLATGDTILIMQNPDLVRSIEDERDELERKRLAFKQSEIQMQRRTTELIQASLRSAYDLRILAKDYELAKAEFQMGAINRSILERAEEIYHFGIVNTEMQMENLRSDSLLNAIQLGLLQNDFQREERRFARSRERLDNLIVRAPIAGQLSIVNVNPGDRVSVGGTVGELKVIDRFKITTRISEFYIDRISSDLPATIMNQNRSLPLRITRIDPEVRDRQFVVDFVLQDEIPENIRIGMNYRIQIELGQPEETLIIPKGSFFQATGGQWIFKINETGDKATRVSISIGRQNPQQYEISDGLKPGDRVIVSGYDNFGDAEEIVLR